MAAYNQYRENSVYTASPEELTLMLYNGLIKFIMKAQNAISKKDIEGANENILRAQDIVSELMSTLDKKYEIANNLEMLYDFMLRRLIEANVKKSCEILDEVLEFAKELRDTWEQAMRIARKQTRSSAAAAGE
nr:flagellar export chaperone FliS [Thermoclostridium stercorarium]